ncbi:MAG: 3-deoxy-manno-octulosonate cytidylyltransferase [Gammaproteobacteria bacterium]|nr:3-deoxy-manno-octulosonate cytidylyltransferase [Gammaproteobacteria bacterium]
MSYSIVIPARYAATRLPGKPLREIAGKTLLQHVYECAQRTQAHQIIIATDDDRIRQVAAGFGADVCMTAASHQSGTQRINEVIELRGIADDEIIVNLQGDEPLMPAACVSQVAQLLLDNPAVQMSTLATPVLHDDEVFDSNVVKVALNKHNHALYFSRATIPWQRGTYEQHRVERTETWTCLRHIGIYGYRAVYIKEYVSLPPSPLEMLESLEQLRVLWHGGTIMVGQAVEVPGPGVDTEQDFAKVSRLMQQTG